MSRTITLTEGARYVDWLGGPPGAIPAWLRAESEAPAV